MLASRPEKKAMDMSDFQDFTMEKKSEDHIDSMNSGEGNCLLSESMH